VGGDRPPACNVGNKDIEQKLILESDSGEAVFHLTLKVRLKTPAVGDINKYEG
jgi:hypothetical protein